MRRRGLRVAAGLYVGLIFLFLYLPIGVLVLFSFNKSRLNAVWTGFTFDWYHQLFSDYSIWVAAEQQPDRRAWRRPSSPRRSGRWPPLPSTGTPLGARPLSSRCCSSQS